MRPVVSPRWMIWHLVVFIDFGACEHRSLGVPPPAGTSTLPTLPDKQRVEVHMSLMRKFAAPSAVAGAVVAVAAVLVVSGNAQPSGPSLRHSIPDNHCLFNKIADLLQPRPQLQ